ncbi:hypothetical protein [Natrinema salaciae]|uniref:Uncharacterized protein n=1 Tax=Natrinema salaciae TaxID=1186196 RepID=A0A1H9CHD5_9EURY|nr:hypothetical protein [Natrinema salaciae]SEQ00427.1 hypothetical protein SAMN04489841_1050 [Natrinema salaciae]
MTTEPEHPVHARLEEILSEVRVLNRQLIHPLTLDPAIRNLKETIEVYKRLEAEDLDSAEGGR